MKADRTHAWSKNLAGSLKLLGLTRGELQGQFGPGHGQLSLTSLPTSPIRYWRRSGTLSRKNLYIDSSTAVAKRLCQNAVGILLQVCREDFKSKRTLTTTIFIVTAACMQRCVFCSQESLPACPSLP